MIKTVPRYLYLTGPTIVLGITLSAINGPFAEVVISLAIFFSLSWIGSLLSANSHFQLAANGQFSTWQLQVGPFLAGGMISILAWESLIALNLPLYWGAGLFLFSLISVSALRGRQLNPQHLNIVASRSFNLAQIVSTSAISMLLIVAAVPDLRSWLIPLSILNVLGQSVPRFKRAAGILALTGTVAIVRHATGDPGVMVFTDDSVWAESFSSIIGQTGFWSWGGMSDIYLPLHWFAYGIAGWFTRATQHSFLFGVTKAFPAVMAVVGGFIVSQLRIKGSDKLSFSLQVLAIICGLQLIGSESISADLGFVALLAFTRLIQQGQSTSALAYISLICVGFAKVQFVPVAMILIFVCNFLQIKTFGLSVVSRRIAIQLGTILVVILIVLDKIPLSKVFDWETRAGWGYSMVQWNGSELLKISSLLEIINKTIFVFVPAIVILLIYLLTSTTPQLVDLAAPLSVTATSLLANILFKINNFVYFGWVSTAMCLLFLFEPIVENVKAYLRKWLKASSFGFVLTITLFVFLISLQKYDVWQSLKRTQYVIALLLAMFVLSLLVPKIGRNRYTTSLKFVFWSSGVTLLCLPSLVYTSDLFRASESKIVPKSGFSLTALGYTDDLVRAGRWVRQHTNSRDIVATNILCEFGTTCPLDGRPLVSAVTHRRTYIEAERFAFGYSPIPSGNTYPSWIANRLRASLNCAKLGDDQSCTLLKSAGVNLMIVDTYRSPTSPNLETCATFGTIKVVSLQKSPDGTANCPRRGIS